MINRTAIIEGLEALDDSTLIELWNDYCDYNNDPDSSILSNDDDFFETYFSGRISDAVSAAVYGDYNPHHNYVCFNGNGNLQSFSYATEDGSPICFSDLADWLIRNKDEDEIAELLDIELEDEPEA